MSSALATHLSFHCPMIGDTPPRLTRSLVVALGSELRGLDQIPAVPLWKRSAAGAFPFSSLRVMLVINRVARGFMLQPQQHRQLAASRCSPITSSRPFQAHLPFSTRLKFLVLSIFWLSFHCIHINFSVMRGFLL